MRFRTHIFYLLRTEVKKGALVAIEDTKNEIELWRKLGKMEADIENIGKQVESISAKIDRLDLTSVMQRLAKLETDTDNHEERIKKAEDNQAKIVWLVVAAVVGAVLKMVIIDRSLRS